MILEKKKKKNKECLSSSITLHIQTQSHSASGGGGPPINTPHNLWTQEMSSKNLHRRRRGLAPEPKGIFSLLQINTAIFKCLHTASRTCLHTHTQNSKKQKKASYHLFSLFFLFPLTTKTLTTCKRRSVWSDRTFTVRVGWTLQKGRVWTLREVCVCGG